MLTKYSSLKEELLANNMYHITQGQWNDVSEEVRHYHDTNYCKERSKFKTHTLSTTNGAQHTEDDAHSVMGIEHVLALLLYTNFSILRHHFLKTYYRRRIATDQRHSHPHHHVSPSPSSIPHEKESHLSLRSRHSNFAIFARLLNEAVQWFGAETADSCFYHILNSLKIVFNSTTTQICIPLSTSTNYHVMLNQHMEIEEEKGMRNNKYCGMILTLHASHEHNARYFDTSFLSKFVNEEEALFIGGHTYLLFADIIQPVIGLKYAMFLRAFTVIGCVMKGDWYQSPEFQATLPRKLQQYVLDLLYYQLSLSQSSDMMPFDAEQAIPEYMAKVLYFYCTNINELTLNWSALTLAHNKKYAHWHGYLFLHKLLLCASHHHHQQFINLNVLYSLFPNLTLIKLTTTRHSHLYLSHFAMQQMLHFLQAVANNNHCKLHEIHIKKPSVLKQNSHSLSIQQAIHEYSTHFQALNWTAHQIQDRYKDKYLVLRKL